MTLEIREFQPDLQVREATDGKWTFEGIAVPYGQTIQHGDIREEFVRGAFADYEGGATLYGQHGHLRGEFPIGKVEHAEERDEGLFVRAKISQTDRGREAYTLLKDGVLSKLSIGFAPVQHQIRSDDQGDVVVRTKARFGEVSIVGMPAYSGAAITSVREQDPTSPDASSDNPEGADMADDITEVRAEIADLTRTVEVLKAEGARSGSKESPMKYRSLGEFLKAASQGEATREEALQIRAANATSPATTADHGAQRPAWIARDIELVQQNRDILELFSKDALPAQGMTVTYPVFGNTSGDVAIQATEGANLTYLELATSTGSSPVKTYGGYSSLSRQVIERSDASYLNKVLDFQKISYAKVTNTAVRTLLTGGSATYNTVPLSIAGAGAVATAAKTYLTAALNGANAIANNSAGLSADAWIMSADQFLALATIVDSTGRPIFALNGDGANTIGDVSLLSMKARVGTLPVFVDSGLTGTNSFIVSREAITVMEDGAKYLSDENIVNLTKDFSIYGYLALTLNDVKGITTVNHAAV